MRYFKAFAALALLALSPIAFAQQYVGPTLSLPPGCNSTNYLRGDNSCNVPPGSGGTVTSVGLTVPTWLTVSGSPVTTSGVLALSTATGQTANSFVATPSGSTGAVSLRTITLADLPTIPATQGGTGQITITIGDLLYGSASNVLSKLAGNTTTSKRFLTQTGDGTNSAAPGWAAIASADLASLAPSLGDTAVTNLNVTGTNLPTTGLSKSGGGSLLFNTAGVTRGAFSSGTGGIFSTNGGILSAGTKFTTSGCSVSASTGGATAGVFTLGANSCTVVITMNGATGVAATSGWHCDAHNKVAAPIYTGESSSTTTTASIPIPSAMGATDVVSFSCTGY